MSVLVLTVDQRDSRPRTDRIPTALEPPRWRPRAPPSSARSATSSRACWTTPPPCRRPSSRCCATASWSIGVGVGPVDWPPPPHARAGAGPAYLHARARRRRRPRPAPGTPASSGSTPAPASSRRRCGYGPRCWPAAPRAAGRSPTSPTRGLSYDEIGEPPRHQPVGGQPTGAGGRHRGGAPGPRAGRRAHHPPARDEGKAVSADDWTAQDWGTLALVLLGFGLLCSLPAWTASGRRIWAPLTLVALLAGAVVAATPDQVSVDRSLGGDPGGRPGWRARDLRRWSPDRARLRPGRPSGDPGRVHAARPRPRCCGRRLDRRASSGARSSRPWSQAGPRGSRSCSHSRAFGRYPELRARPRTAYARVPRSASSSARSRASSGPAPAPGVVVLLLR